MPDLTPEEIELRIVSDPNVEVWVIHAVDELLDLLETANSRVTALEAVVRDVAGWDSEYGEYCEVCHMTGHTSLCEVRRAVELMEAK